VEHAFGRQVGLQAQLAGKVSHPTPNGDGIRAGAEPQDADRAGVGPDQIQQTADGRRLARAVGAQEAQDLASPDLQVDAAQGLHLAVGFFQPFNLDGQCLIHL